MSLTPIGRVSFPQVFEAKAAKPGDEPKFSIKLLFTIDEQYMSDYERQILASIGSSFARQMQLFNEMKSLAEQVNMEGFKVGLGAVYMGKPLNSPIKTHEMDPKWTPEGCVSIRFASKERPGVVDKAKMPIDVRSGQFYAGCFAHTSYGVYSYDNTGNRGTAFGLNNVQKMGDGPKLGGGTTAEQDFDNYGGTPAAPTPQGYSQPPAAASDDIPF